MPPRPFFPRAAKPGSKDASKKSDGKRNADSLNGDAEATPPRKKKTKKEIPQKLDEELLAADLNTDYSKRRKNLRNLRPQMPKKQKWPKVNGVVREREDAPQGWNPEEPDLMPDDLESQIARCLERITENIMPHVYQHKLAELMAKQAERNTLIATEPGLSWPVVQRLDNLKFTLDWLIAENDQYKMVDTVKAIIAQYRSGELDWHPEFVTYWHAGVQLCLPRPFHWEEYRSIHDKCEGHEGFWVEDFDSMPTRSACQCHNGSYFPLNCRIGHLLLGPISNNLLQVRFSLRIPQAQPPDGKGLSSFEFPFMDDTGSTHMSIFEDDISILQDNKNHPLPRCLGVGLHYTSDDRRVPALYRELEVNMWSVDDKCFMSNWEPIPVSIRSGHATRAGADRLSGSWLRHRFYTGTCPDQSMRLWVFNYNPGIPPQGEKTLPTATPAQLTAPFRIGALHPIADFPHLDPTLASGHSLI
ncbi:unnamed protein product [Penicillium nalgiovense]|uniref:Uncharacterized protein n=1 Tax=Penicillium nalgiovense TaxID=60175 RepID=A0A9W4HGK9_PENNA|nr:unnamed protein product [Penicillium nalgiovense]CAG7939195.1 unnamed protein product [Penicillium nalgiovense]CAG7961088.1 unnamed protein product [Penicillium nalgiovense]CAG7986293.1 unnamed protein product [Penicillium nalgiovense]CAG7986977.1 unnamed protein product [Penicillium nalgiovense]